MILVTGATGHVGSELIAQLSAHGVPTRAMTRRPHATEWPSKVEAVYGDADDPASLDAAFDGVDRAFLMSAQAVGSAERPTHDLRLVQAAQRAGVRHVVKLSVYSGGTGDDVLAEWHRAAEAAVVGSGMDWTLLRPGRFMSNALHWAPMLRRGDTVHAAFATRPSASIDPADIAAVALTALATGEHRNVGYRLSGPQVLTPEDEMGILAKVLHRPLSLVEVPVESATAGMIAAGMSPGLVDAILARTLNSDEGAEVLPTVTHILGRPPTTFEEWAVSHAADFSGAHPNG
jgi:uncharacterized protein YbjT (DUF2867 family)